MRSKIGKLLRFIGICIFVIGFILGAFAAMSKNLIFFIKPNSFFSWSMALTLWFETLIFGMVFIGLAEVIKLLESQKNDFNRIEDNHIKVFNELARLKNDMTNNYSILAEYLNASENSNEDNNETNDDLINIDKENFEKISNQYTANLIKRITYTPFQDIYMIIEKNKKYLITYTGADAIPLDEDSISNNMELREWFQNHLTEI